MTRRTALAGGFAAAMALGATALTPAASWAFEPRSTLAVNVADGVAIKGYDPVAYFTQGAPTLGRPDHTATHDGATFRFASAENRDLFRADPARYAPAYGGFCAFAVSYGDKVDIDPEAWHIEGGTLYLNVSKRIQRRWQRDVANHIQRGDTNWPRIRDVAPADL